MPHPPQRPPLSADPGGAAEAHPIPAAAPSPSAAGFGASPPLLLVSPTSGGGRGERALEAVREALAAHGITPIVHRSTSLGDASERVRRAGADTLVIALGGDGLIGAAAGAAAETGALLLPLAGGRGNDTVRRLGLGLDPVDTAHSILTLTEHRIDLAWVTTADGRAASGLAYLGVLASGFDGVANELGNAVRFPLGPLTYLVGGARALFRFRGARFTVSVDGAETSQKGWFMAVANHGQYGGGITISPDSRINDGHLEVVSLWGGTVARVAAVLLTAYRAAHLGMRGVEVQHGRQIRITADQPLGVFVDGERVGQLPATVSVRASALRVLAGTAAPALGSEPR